MPDINGIEVQRNVRQTDKTWSFDHRQPASSAVERSAGADDFITKPFDPEHLAMVVKALDVPSSSKMSSSRSGAGGRNQLVAMRRHAGIIDEAKKPRR
jgi:DNA-binding response OmpR family regulator